MEGAVEEAAEDPSVDDNNSPEADDTSTTSVSPLNAMRSTGAASRPAGGTSAASSSGGPASALAMTKAMPVYTTSCLGRAPTAYARDAPP